MRKLFQLLQVDVGAKMQYLAVLRIVQNNGSAFGLGQNCDRTIPGLVGDRLDWWRQTLPVDQVFGNNMIKMILAALMKDVVKPAIVYVVLVRSGLMSRVCNKIPTTTGSLQDGIVRPDSQVTPEQSLMLSSLMLPSVCLVTLPIICKHTGIKYHQLLLWHNRYNNVLRRRQMA